MKRTSAMVVLHLVALLGAAAAPVTAEPDDPTPSNDSLQQDIDPDQKIAAGEAVLETGHVDLGPRYAAGGWNLMVHDDTRVDGSVWRHLERTVVRVTDAAVQQVPDDPAYEFLGVEPATGVHVIPQTQNPDVVWLGWNTQDPQVMETVDRGVTLSLRSVDGPGHLVVYLQDGGFGEPDVLWDSRRDGEQEIWVDVNTHTHANWVFSEPGIYLVTIAATAALVDGSEETTTGTLRLAVGEDVDPDEALAAEPASTVGGADTGTPDERATTYADEPQSDDASALAQPIAGAAVLLTAGLVLVVWRGRRTRARALAEADGEDT